MAKQGGPFIFEKTLGIVSLYKRCGVGLARCKSNLTAERWRNDPAFAGSRKSAAELKAAAVIAAPFYKALPENIRIFSLYRQLVGLAKKLLAKQTPIPAIEQTLALAVIRLRKMADTLAQQKPKQPAKKETGSTSHPVTIKSVEKYWRVKHTMPFKHTPPSIKVLPSPHSLWPNTVRLKSQRRRTRAGSAQLPLFPNSLDSIAA
ncbi:hypothetical protein [Filimonas effusa]|uniref:Uncharacterized protein n=1 Tax=Filimonas effusa TaxID=2508721 RepID=A0A4Q1D550_9BACT|nr:hypothetical protein [Filimonas effusa]RXK82761.1 hypothetical protein ESB13_11510 [Filimonas effusa]